MATVKVNKSNFELEVMNSTTPVLVDFYADWCMPCKMLGPILEQVSEEQNVAKVCKINIEESPELAQKYEVMSIPTLVLVKNGAEVKRSVGASSKAAILNMING